MDGMSRLPLGPPLPIKDRSSGPRAPDVEIALFPLSALNRGKGLAPAGLYGVTFAPILLRPSSSGTISLRFASVYDPPVIDPKYVRLPSLVFLPPPTLWWF